LPATADHILTLDEEGVVTSRDFRDDKRGVVIDHLFPFANRLERCRAEAVVTSHGEFLRSCIRDVPIRKVVRPFS
jgi:hypothetical protein